MSKSLYTQELGLRLNSIEPMQCHKIILQKWGGDQFCITVPWQSIYYKTHSGGNPGKSVSNIS